MKPRVFSGIKPSGGFTVGNYLGAIRHWAADQDRFDNIFCVVDLHAITVSQDPDELRHNTWEAAALLLAAGIDPARSLLFVQSHVNEHTTLCWLLNNITPVGWLNRMTQFKSIAEKEREKASAGLYDYPVLMAADILLYHTNVVPVGEDQKQHVELTRDIAQRFNSMYGDTFTVPEPMIPRVGARIMSLDDPSKKMSKSDPGGAAFLLDAPDEIRKKVGRAVTDSMSVVRFSPQQPGLLNLLEMIQVMTGQTREEIEQELGGQGYKAVKDRVSELIIDTLQPLKDRYLEYEREPEVVDEILRLGAKRAREMANPLLKDVENRIGLRTGTESKLSERAI